ncbi:DeoR family transcriptional regulator [Patescibacteria group bacterium]|nr:MAG: DeoR family transcriptional regulator [Patescibacteria group bacterium]
MDYKKDIKDNAVISHSSQGGMEVFGIRTSKKCERLATAIYLVTNFLSDTEPMKSRLRTLSLELVRDASFIKNGNQIAETNVLESLRSNVIETLSLFELAFVAGLVSEMNFSILKREYASLRDSIDIKKASRESRTDTILGDNFFGTPNQEIRSDLKNLSPRSVLAGTPEGRTFANQFPVSPKGHSIGQTNTSMSDRNIKGQSVASRQSVPLTMLAQTPKPKIPNSVTKEARRSRILKLIKDNREVTIKDIITHFPDVSEKTIQRELVAMSDSGVLKKIGDRRWSRYALA